MFEAEAGEWHLLGPAEGMQAAAAVSCRIQGAQIACPHRQRAHKALMALTFDLLLMPRCWAVVEVKLLRPSSLHQPCDSALGSGRAQQRRA